MSNLSDARAKVTRITLRDGVERELRYTLNAMAEMEDRYGTVEDAFKALEANSIQAVRFMLWAGLAHSDENLTERQVGDLIDVACMEEIMKQVGVALNNDMPEEGSAVPNAQAPVQLRPV